MAKYELTNAADRDLTDIYSYTFEQFGEQQADSYLAGLEDCFCHAGGKTQARS